MSKFTSEAVRALYMSGAADIEKGSSADMGAWAGAWKLYDDERGKFEGAPWVVLVEGSDGFVDVYRCHDEEQAAALVEQYGIDTDGGL